MNQISKRLTRKVVEVFKGLTNSNPFLGTVIYEYVWLNDGFMPSEGAGLAPSVRRQGTACKHLTTTYNNALRGPSEC